VSAILARLGPVRLAVFGHDQPPRRAHNLLSSRALHKLMEILRPTCASGRRRRGLVTAAGTRADLPPKLRASDLNPKDQFAAAHRRSTKGSRCQSETYRGGRSSLVGDFALIVEAARARPLASVQPSGPRRYYVCGQDRLLPGCLIGRTLGRIHGDRRPWLA
jgi:hypothetical protein